MRSSWSFQRCALLVCHFNCQSIYMLKYPLANFLGDSLSIAPAPHPPWIVLTPLALPGEKIRVRIYYNSRLYSRADLLEVVKPNPTLRDMNRVKCKYFGECGGCQYQVRHLSRIHGRVLTFCLDAFIRNSTRSQTKCCSESL